jgi:hypothetical protein
MGLDTKTYWLTDRQSQCNFDFDFEIFCVTNILSWAPDGARHQDRQTDWLTVSRNVTLTLTLICNHTRVEAGSNTSTVTLRVVGGDDKGSCKSETVKMVARSKGLGPEKDCTGEGQQHIQKTDPSSRQRGRPTKTRPLIRTIKSRRMRQARHIACMGEKRNAHGFWWRRRKKRDHSEHTKVGGWIILNKS